MTKRAVPEWVGKTPDTKVPPRVRLRVLLAHEGCCYLSGRKIGPADKWEIEHKLSLALGGENREGNLAPALVEPHKEKTRADRKQQAKDERIRKKHMGIKTKRQTLPGSKGSRLKRKLNGEVVYRDQD